MHDQPDYYLRKFKPDDLSGVKTLIHRTIEDAFARLYTPQALEYHKKVHTPQQILRDVVNGHTVVIEDKGKIIATGTLLGSTIKRVFIDPAHQKQGLGKRIMYYLEKHALKNGRHNIYLDAATNAKDFYLHLGYQIDKETYVPLENNTRLDYYKMSKSILEAGKPHISYHKKMFRPLPGQGSGFTEDTVLYHFQQTNNRVWVSFKGGMVSYGQMLGLCQKNGILNASFQYLTRDEILTHGICKITPTIMKDNRLNLHVEWQLDNQASTPGIISMEELDLNPNGSFFD